MSAEFDELRRIAVETALGELGRHVREVGMQNRGPRVDVYLREAGIGQGTMDGETQQSADARMWCGMFVYYCYAQASRQLNLPLPFTGRNLWGGRRLRIWAHAHQDAVVTDGNVQAGDIFAVRNDHVGMAIGAACDGIFRTIEGNQGELGSNWDGIQRKRQNISNCRIIVRI